MQAYITIMKQQFSNSNNWQSKYQKREVTSFKPAYSLSPTVIICVFSKLTGPSWTENTIQQMNCYSAGKCGQSILCYPPDTDLSTTSSMGYWCITFISNSRLTNSQTSLIFIFFCYKQRQNINIGLKNSNVSFDEQSEPMRTKHWVPYFVSKGNVLSSS